MGRSAGSFYCCQFLPGGRSTGTNGPGPGERGRGCGIRSKAIILDETPADFRPILQVIDNYDRNAKLGTIFEARVGKGKLLVCAMDLDTDLAQRPAARQLRYSLMQYAAGKEFNPVAELPVELLDRLLQP